jgi:hypothetical protein
MIKHVFIVGTARTGGTWFGKMFDTSPHTCYLWEPDNFRFHKGDQFWRWPFDDTNEILYRAFDFKEHVPINPKFVKQRYTHIVSKLCQSLGMINIKGKLRRTWPDGKFDEIREKTNAMVFHLVRHPVRWAASVQRWGPRSDAGMADGLKLYTRINMEFCEAHCGKPYYSLVRHEALASHAISTMGRIFIDCGLEIPDAFFRYAEEMHARDEDDGTDAHSHKTIMTQDSVLNRWKTSKRIKGVIDLANKLVEEQWEDIYTPLA